MIHDTTLICECGGRIRIEDFRGKGYERQYRYEAFCDKCKTCDPNGWPTLAVSLAEAATYFQAGT